MKPRPKVAPDTNDATIFSAVPFLSSLALASASVSDSKPKLPPPRKTFARTRAFLDPNSDRWNAPGLGNTLNSIHRDQA